MYGDLTKIRQVLLNLLSNASKFTENGTVRLTVTTLEQDGIMWINFVISDNGIGIPPDKQQFLFQAFRQVDGSTTRKYGGTGLGLVISKRFVEMMGGTITLQSTPGQGTAFTVTLPTKIAIPQPQEELPITKVRPAATPEKCPMVLVIDDDANT